MKHHLTRIISLSLIAAFLCQQMSWAWSEHSALRPVARGEKQYVSGQDLTRAWQPKWIEPKSARGMFRYINLVQKFFLLILLAFTAVSKQRIIFKLAGRIIFGMMIGTKKELDDIQLFKIDGRQRFVTYSMYACSAVIYFGSSPEGLFVYPLHRPIFGRGFKLTNQAIVDRFIEAGVPTIRAIVIPGITISATEAQEATIELLKTDDISDVHICRAMHKSPEQKLNRMAEIDITEKKIDITVTDYDKKSLQPQRFEKFLFRRKPRIISAAKIKAVFTALSPLKENPSWPIVRGAIQGMLFEQFHKSGRGLMGMCYLWKADIVDKLIKADFVKKIATNGFNLSEKDGHVWVEINLKDDPNCYVLDRTIGMFADENIIKLYGGLEGLRNILNPVFLDKNKITTDADLVRKFTEFDANNGFYGLREDYPFVGTETETILGTPFDLSNWFPKQWFVPPHVAAAIDSAVLRSVAAGERGTGSGSSWRMSTTASAAQDAEMAKIKSLLQRIVDRCNVYGLGWLIENGKFEFTPEGLLMSGNGAGSHWGECALSAMIVKNMLNDEGIGARVAPIEMPHTIYSQIRSDLPFEETSPPIRHTVVVTDNNIVIDITPYGPAVNNGQYCVRLEDHPYSGLIGQALKPSGKTRRAAEELDKRDDFNYQITYYLSRDLNRLYAFGMPISCQNLGEGRFLLTSLGLSFCKDASVDGKLYLVFQYIVEHMIYDPGQKRLCAPQRFDKLFVLPAEILSEDGKVSLDIKAMLESGASDDIWRFFTGILNVADTDTDEHNNTSALHGYPDMMPRIRARAKQDAHLIFRFILKLCEAGIGQERVAAMIEKCAIEPLSLKTTLTLTEPQRRALMERVPAYARGVLTLEETFGMFRLAQAGRDVELRGILREFVKRHRKSLESSSSRLPWDRVDTLPDKLAAAFMETAAEFPGEAGSEARSWLEIGSQSRRFHSAESQVIESSI